MDISNKHRTLLDSIFYNESGGQGAFATMLPLYREAKDRDASITQNIVRRYLSSISSYLTHKRVLRKYRRKSTLVMYPGDVFCADLIFFINEQTASKKKRP